MDKLRGAFRAKAILIICLAFAVAAVVCLSAHPYVDAEAAGERQAYVLHDKVKMYADPALTDVVAELTQNALVDIIDVDNIGGDAYYLAECGGNRGYINAKYVYFANLYGKELKLKYGICLTDRVGKPVEIREAPSDEAAVKYTLIDGTRLEVADCGVDGYYYVMSDDRGGYISIDNVTDGLSRNYQVALAIGIVCLITLVTVLSLIYVRRNKEYIATHKANRLKAKRSKEQ